MRAFLGLIQLGLGIAGLIALFNGQWLAMIAAWVGAFAVGWFGNRMSRMVTGISETGQEAIAMVSRAEKLIRDGQYSSASGLALGAVNGFRNGGDKTLLPLAFSVRAVALGGIGDVVGARKALSAMDTLLRTPPPGLEAEYSDLQVDGASLVRELNRIPFDPTRFVNLYIEMGA